MVAHSIEMILYTEVEGGDWIPWPKDKSCIVLQRQLKKRSYRTININGVSIHSFKTSTGRRWDCRNGWTQ